MASHIYIYCVNNNFPFHIHQYLHEILSFLCNDYVIQLWLPICPLSNMILIST